MNKLSCVSMIVAASLFAGVAAAAPLMGGEGVGGGEVSRVSAPGPSTPKDYHFWSTYQSSGPKADVTSYVYSLRMGLKLNPELVRSSLIKVVSDTQGRVGDSSLSVTQAVDMFLTGFATMERRSLELTGLHIEEFVAGVNLQERVDNCVDHNGRSVDLCTEISVLNSPIYVTKSFLVKRESHETYAGLFYHEITRKLLGQEDDNHIHASVVRLSILFYRDGFFSQGICQVEQVACEGRDFSLEVIGGPGLPIPVPGFGCTDRVKTETEWFFDFDRVFDGKGDSASFRNGVFGRKVTLNKVIQSNVGIREAKFMNPKPNLAGRFSFLMIEGFDPKNKPHGDANADSWGCSVVPSVTPPVTTKLSNQWFETYVSQWQKWNSVCQITNHPRYSEAYCDKENNWWRDRRAILNKLSQGAASL